MLPTTTAFNLTLLHNQWSYQDLPSARAWIRLFRIPVLREEAVELLVAVGLQFSELDPRPVHGDRSEERDVNTETHEEQSPLAPRLTKNDVVGDEGSIQPKAGGNVVETTELHINLLHLHLTLPSCLSSKGTLALRGERRRDDAREYKYRGERLDMWAPRRGEKLDMSSIRYGVYRAM
ncbi:hypothetical protein L2E82_16303 [Cichorium intybus]|uniref:Uncharacterized protein n=1 Tax=Cichorium intybus TaxID=13427 RepID=A0ACB9F5U3_CICIN|nr:hypothetical protein L2E82_16303 [Cichorium intybus]